MLAKLLLQPGLFELLASVSKDPPSIAGATHDKFFEFLERLLDGRFVLVCLGTFVKGISLRLIAQFTDFCKHLLEVIPKIPKQILNEIHELGEVFERGGQDTLNPAGNDSCGWMHLDAIRADGLSDLQNQPHQTRCADSLSLFGVSGHDFS